MRVLIAADRIGPLNPLTAANATGHAFADAGAQVAVVPMSDAGVAAVVALAELDHTHVVCVDLPTAVYDTQLPTSSSAPLGLAAAGSMADPLIVDLSSLAQTHDAGAGLLGALGATADVPLNEGWPGLRGLSSLSLPDRTGQIIGLVPPQQTEDPLLGLRGISSVRAYEHELPHEHAVDVDGLLENLVDHSGDSGKAHSQTPGAGACGGAAWAVLALGGQVMTGPELIAERVQLAQTVSRCDVVVAVVDHLDFVTRGGGVVELLAQMCNERGIPLVVLAQTQQVSRRELRTFGVEEAHAVGQIKDAAELTQACRSIATGWLLSTAERKHSR